MVFNRTVLSAAVALLIRPADAAPAWNVMEVAVPKAVSAIAAEGDSVWAAADSGIHVSGDGGKSWSGPGRGLGPGRPIAVAKGKESLNAVQGRYLYASKDGGKSWAPSDSLPYGEFTRIEVWKDTIITWYSIFQNNAATASRISADGGATWSEAPGFRAYPPAFRVFRGDTVAIIEAALEIWENGGYREVFRFREPIRDLAAGGDRIFALVGKHIFAADAPNGPWSAVNVGLEPAEIHGLAADSDRMAILTPGGIHLSRNRGRDWEFLHSNFANPQDNKLFMTGSALFVTWNQAYRWSTNWATRRYSFASSAWDTLPIGQHVFAAAGTKVAGSKTENGKLHLAVSTEPASGFVAKGELPQTAWNRAFLSVGGAGFVFSETFSRTGWQSLDEGASWTRLQECQGQSELYNIVVTDYGLFYLLPLGLHKRTLDSCGILERLALPEGFSDFEPLTIGSWDGRKLIVGKKGRIAVWGESEPIPLIRKPYARPPSATRTPLPVRAWPLPGQNPSSGRWIDALGTIRP